MQTIASQGEGAAAPAVLLSAPVPRPEAIRALARADAHVNVTHEQTLEGGQIALMELLHSGLTFDLTGWDQTPAPVDQHDQRFDFDGAPDQIYGALNLSTGPHISGAAAMLPVVRVMTGLLCRLARLEGVKAVRWLPAQSIMSVDYFEKVIGTWLKGGVFPGLGLVSLQPDRAGNIRTQGMGYFGSQELVFPKETFANPRQIAEIAVRLIDELVGNPPLAGECTVMGPGGSLLLLSPSEQGEVLRVLR